MPVLIILSEKYPNFSNSGSLNNFFSFAFNDSVSTSVSSLFASSAADVAFNSCLESSSPSSFIFVTLQEKRNKQDKITRKKLDNLTF